MNNRDYTSNLLCHFVGRSQTDDEKRYRLLVKIIKNDHALFANPDDPSRINFSFSMGEFKGNQGELFDRNDCVCFCDIPNKSLDIHRHKYSSFGMGFKKSFLISQGARPVTYVPKGCSIRDILKVGNPEEPETYFCTIDRKAYSATNMLLTIEKAAPLEEQLENILPKTKPTFQASAQKTILNPLKEELDSKNMNNFLGYLYSVWMTECAYIKIFDDNLPIDDINNYYMEREWRCIHNVKFSLFDIDTIYLPNKSYKERFKKDFPEFKGKFYLFEKICKS